MNPFKQFNAETHDPDTFSQLDSSAFNGSSDSTHNSDPPISRVAHEGEPDTQSFQGRGEKNGVLPLNSEYTNKLKKDSSASGSSDTNNWDLAHTIEFGNAPETYSFSDTSSKTYKLREHRVYSLPVLVGAPGTASQPQKPFLFTIDKSGFNDGNHWWRFDIKGALLSEDFQIKFLAKVLTTTQGQYNYGFFVGDYGKHHIRFELRDDLKYQIMAMKRSDAWSYETLANATSIRFDPKKWNEFTIEFSNSRFAFSINGEVLETYPVCKSQDDINCLLIEGVMSDLGMHVWADADTYLQVMYSNISILHRTKD